MLETLENLSTRLRMPPAIPAEVDKIRECINDNKSATMELEKLQPSFEALKRRGEELIARSQGADKDLAAKGTWMILYFFHHTQQAFKQWCLKHHLVSGIQSGTLPPNKACMHPLFFEPSPSPQIFFVLKKIRINSMLCLP